MVVSTPIVICILLSLIAVRLWIPELKRRDYCLVEYRTLNIEARDSSLKWENLSSANALHALGFRTTSSGKILKGDVWLATRSLDIFDEPTAALAYVNYLGMPDPRPHFKRAMLIVWVVRARSERDAQRQVLFGRGHILNKVGGGS